MNLKVVTELENILNQYITDKGELNTALNLLSRISDELISSELKVKEVKTVSARYEQSIAEEKTRSDMLTKMLLMVLKECLDIDFSKDYIDD